MQKMLYEFGGVATVYIKALCDFRQYKIGDVIAVLKDVNVNFNSKDSQVLSKKSTETLLSYNERSLNNIEIGNVAMTHEIMQLLNFTVEKIFSITHNETWTKNLGNTFFLKCRGIKKDSIQLVPSMPYEYKETINALVLHPEEDVENCEIYYQTDQSGVNYVLSNHNDLPYLTLEFYFEGNANKKTSHSFILVPKANLVDEVNLNITNTEITDLVLRFNIINDKEVEINMW